VSLLEKKRALERELNQLKNEIAEGDEVRGELAAQLAVELEVTEWVAERFAAARDIRAKVRDRLKEANREIVRIRRDARRVGVYDESFDVRIDASGVVAPAIKRGANGDAEPAPEPPEE